MTLAESIRRAATLPPEKQEEIADIVNFLVARAQAATGMPEHTALELNQPFFGMWADRDDMKDSTAHVRKLRENEWERRHAAD
ncbi:MAG: hypothetical protein Q8O52_15205 [Sulfuritalea sp.]|nr:hypothetical protein [Sulfuritalea sp.]